jgi:hypothetical protein
MVFEKEEQVFVTQKDRTVFAKKGALQWFGEEIRKHLVGWTMGDIDFMIFGLVSDEKISDVNVPGALAAGKFPIAFEFDRAFVILVEGCSLDGVTLGGHEILDVEYVWQVVTCSNQFGFGRALGVDFLFGGFADKATTAERNNTTGVAAHIWVYGERSVYPSIKVVEGVRPDD